MSERAVELKDCAGCRDDFYNHNRMGLNETPDGPRCWHSKTATFVEARDVHRDQRPPYLHLPLVERPSCYRGTEYVRVKPDALTAEGYWR